jgi:hypothetical protein
MARGSVLKMTIAKDSITNIGGCRSHHSPDSTSWSFVAYSCPQPTVALLSVILGGLGGCLVLEALDLV